MAFVCDISFLSSKPLGYVPPPGMVRITVIHHVRSLSLRVVDDRARYPDYPWLLKIHPAV